MLQDHAGVRTEKRGILQEAGLHAHRGDLHAVSLLRLSPSGAFQSMQLLISELTVTVCSVYFASGLFSSRESRDLLVVWDKKMTNLQHDEGLQIVKVEYDVQQLKGPSEIISHLCWKLSLRRRYLNIF